MSSLADTSFKQQRNTGQSSKASIHSPKQAPDYDPKLLLANRTKSLPDEPPKYATTSKLHPIWSTTRGRLILAGVVLLLLAAVVGGAVGGALSKDGAVIPTNSTSSSTSLMNDNTASQGPSSLSSNLTVSRSSTVPPSNTPQVQGDGGENSIQPQASSTSSPITSIPSATSDQPSSSSMSITGPSSIETARPPGQFDGQAQS